MKSTDFSWRTSSGDSSASMATKWTMRIISPVHPRGCGEQAARYAAVNFFEGTGSAFISLRSALVLRRAKSMAAAV